MTFEPITVNLRSLARDLDCDAEQLLGVVSLLDDGVPLPFIARYRRDVTHGLGVGKLSYIASEVAAARTFAERKMSLMRSLDEQGKLTPELEKKIREARSMRRLEDLHLPFRQRRQSPAATSRQRERRELLEPLAREILDGTVTEERLDARAAEFVDPDRGVTSVADALLGAGHIIGEWFSEKPEVRHRLRELFQRAGKITAQRAPGFVIPATETLPDNQENTVSVAPETEPTTEPVPEVVSEPAIEPVPESTIVSDTEPVITIGAVAEIGAEFQRWRKTQLESGLAPSVIPAPSPRSQQRKKVKAALKQKKAAAAMGKMRHHERVFNDYFAFTAPVRDVPPYRIFGLQRGESEGVLKVDVTVPRNEATTIVLGLCVPTEHPHKTFLEGCARETLERTLLPAMEVEVRKSLIEQAEQQTIRVLAGNLRTLLLQPPLSRRRVVALIPVGSGRKKESPVKGTVSRPRREAGHSVIQVAALDEFGNLLAHETVVHGGSAEKKSSATATLTKILAQFNITLIALANVPGCRATESWLAEIIRNTPSHQSTNLSYVLVSPVGAATYATGSVAKTEFPLLDFSVRSAISIGRRLQNPLVELAKIDPANLGVGMYQHIVKSRALKAALTDVVEACVNRVGADLNTASPELLKYIAGLNQRTANQIDDHRRQHGPFQTRQDLRSVPGLGPVSFEYASGFLRIEQGRQPLDATWIHPSQYPLATEILAKLGFTPDDLRNPETRQRIAAASQKTVAQKAASGENSNTDIVAATILAELSLPESDPRSTLPAPIFRKSVLTLAELTVGMELQGSIINVVEFGAFVDIGLRTSGLVHVSRMVDRFVRSAHEVVAVGDVVRVWVFEVDHAKRRISLSMLPPGTPPHERPQREARPQRESRPQREARPPREAKPREEKPRTERRDPPRETRPSGDRPQRDARPGGDRSRDRDRNREQSRDRGRDRIAKTYVVETAPKKVKPISEDMRTGREALRSFADLAQLFGRVEATTEDNASKQRDKKDSDRKNAEKKAVE